MVTHPYGEAFEYLNLLSDSTVEADNQLQQRIMSLIDTLIVNLPTNTQSP